LAPNQFGIKFMVVIPPHLRTRVVLRGARLDEPGVIKFASNGAGGHTRQQILHLHTGSHWRKYPDLLYVGSSGCYAVTLDVKERPEVITFVAR
jgi:hypothetical protein